MAEFAGSYALETIGNLLIDEAKFLWVVEGKVEDLRRELNLIWYLLRDVDARQEHDQAVGEWVAQLHHVVYDVEDVIERYILRVALKKEQNIIRRYACFVANYTCLQVHGVETEIEGLTSSISYLRASMLAYGIQPVNEGERENAMRSMLEQPYTPFEEYFVGREPDIRVLVAQLLQDGKQHSAIIIRGEGGLGKTTLARKVLNHHMVKIKFDGFAWVKMSQKYRVKDILVGILVQLIPDQKTKVMKMRDHELLETMHKIQQEKRCIVVLDDICNTEEWESIQATFKNTRSKLLITTRSMEVAEYIDLNGYFFNLSPLSNHESWELLTKMLFPKMEILAADLSSVGPTAGQDIVAGQDVEGIARQLKTEQIPVITKDMRILGEELLRKCKGSPLAIIVISGLLAVNKWETVYQKISLYFSNYDAVSDVLLLSYNDLPWHLKQCFLYLSSFPEDAEIPVMEVLRMWIAEGFVSLNAYEKEREITVEDKAEKYLMDLVKRGLVQVQVNLSGKIKNCHLHDIIRALCVDKARQERFLGIHNIQQVNEMENYSSSMAIMPSYEVRRLSLNLHSSDERSMTSIIEQIGRTRPHLRTLMFFQSIKGKLNRFQPTFISCKVLRVLKFEDLYFMRGHLPESVGNLVHLRFLSLKGSDFEGLPQSMGNLPCMEFLDLRVDSYVVVKMPNVLWKMRRLRHLHLPYHFIIKEKFCGDRKKLRLDTLKNLQTLINFGSNNCDVNDVGKLNNLRKLTIVEQNGSDELEIIPQLARFNLRHLQTSSFRFLSLSFTEDDLRKMSSYLHFCKLFIRGKIEKLPEHNYLPQQLRKLVLIYSFLEEDPMPVLEKLKHLNVLLLGNWAFVGNKMVCSAGGFPQLKQLLIDRLPYLEEWRVAKEDIPRFSKLRLGISSCPNLKRIPQELDAHDDCGQMAHGYWK